MRKILSIVCNLTIFLLLLGLSYACQDSLPDISQPALDERQQAITNAKELYAAQIPEVIQTRTVADGPAIRVKPEWKYVTVHKNSEYMAVEVAIKTEYEYYFMTPEAKNLAVNQKDRRYKQSQTRMVFATNQKTQKTDIFMMTIVPDVSYLEQTDFKPFRKISYLKKENNFSGFIFYQNMEGNFVNGWKYTDGAVTHRMTVTDGKKPEVDILPTRSDNWCTAYFLELEIETCASWTVNGEYGGTDCYTRYEWAYWYTVCEEENNPPAYYDGDSGGNGGGGTTGGGTTGNNVAHNVSAGDEVRTTLNRVAENKLIECVFAYINSKQFLSFPMSLLILLWLRPEALILLTECIL
jgi:hypothetical protein